MSEGTMVINNCLELLGHLSELENKIKIFEDVLGDEFNEEQKEALLRKVLSSAYKKALQYH
jgi:hypothetical protein